MSFKSKKVEFAYPTSPDAVRILGKKKGNKTGIYILSVNDSEHFYHTDRETIFIEADKTEGEYRMSLSRQLNKFYDYKGELR